MSIQEKKSYIVFGKPEIGEAEIAEVVDSLRSGWIGKGPKVSRLEDDFRMYKQADHAVAVNSCTAALHLSLVAAGIGPGDEVITTAMTFCATVNAVIHSGATPVLVDSRASDQCIDAELIEGKITPRTKAIIPVHYAGYACDMDRVMAVARKYGLKVIEDCAHAIETTYKGKPVGTFGDAGCFSFYVTKNLVTAEGGMVLFKDAALAERVRVLSLHGMSVDAWKRFSGGGYKHYDVIAPGFKCNMTDLQAALGIHQLKAVEEKLLRRKEIWSLYKEELKGAGLGLPVEPASFVKHAYHLFPLRIAAEAGMDRDRFLLELHERGIGAGVHYQSLAFYPYYQQAFGWRQEDYPQSIAFGAETLSIPLSSGMSAEEVERVVKAVREIMDHA